jgi:O-antigen biosynthesis protein WbqP
VIYRIYGKRVFDILVALSALIALSPVMAVIAVAVFLEDRGPIIFHQLRIGKNGKSFDFLKFRSMPVGTANVASAQGTQLRVTRVGRIIRRFSLDELPQLINVLRGEMSIVGPRPPIPTQQTLIQRRAELRALDVRPGLTGLAQIRSYDGMPEAEKVEYDGEYVRTLSLRGDLSIVRATIGYLMKPPPAY